MTKKRDNPGSKDSARLPRQAPVAALPPLRPSKQQRLRAQLIVAGLELFEKKGFDATTVTQIVEAVGISRRSFFRYFRSKDDLVFDWLEEQAAYVRPRLAARPPEESTFVAMRHAFLELAKYLDANRARAIVLTGIAFETPSLSARYREENDGWEDRLALILQRGRKMSAANDFALRVQISIAVTALVSGIRAWTADNHGGTLHAWVKAAFSALEAGYIQGSPPSKK
jgi:AcrR family transcriptional regulator